VEIVTYLPIHCRTQAGLIVLEHQVEELEELQEVVDCSPNWYAFDRIEVRLNDDRGETIEQLTLQFTRIGRERLEEKFEAVRKSMDATRLRAPLLLGAPGMARGA
jgi:hypothetical protein